MKIPNLQIDPILDLRRNFNHFHFQDFLKEKTDKYRNVFQVCNTICLQMHINSLYCKNYYYWTTRELWSLIATEHTVQQERQKRY